MRVRQQRNRFAVLKTEHNAISSEIEKLIHIALAPSTNGSSLSTNQEYQASADSERISLEAGTVQRDGESSTTAGASSETTNIVQEPSVMESAHGNLPNQDVRQPFAKVDMVSQSSPSAHAGLLVGDHIISFGAVSLRTSSTPALALSLLPGLLREHENRKVDVIVRRGQESNSSIVPLSLTPRRWAGEGLLGCHVVPLEVNQIDPRYAPDVATAAAIHSGTIR